MKRFIGPFLLLMFLIGAAMASEDPTTRALATTDADIIVSDENETSNIIVEDADATPTPKQVQTHSEPVWETRAGIEQVARAYFEAKNDYRVCKQRGDSRGMKAASVKMKSCSNALANFKKKQAERDKKQDGRLDVHSTLVWKHEKQLNGKNGVIKRLDTVEKELDMVAPAIAGIDTKFDAIAWWLIGLTVGLIIAIVIMIVGFLRRFEILSRIWPFSRRGGRQ